MQRASAARPFHPPAPTGERPSLTASLARNGYVQENPESLDLRRPTMRDDADRVHRAAAPQGVRPGLQGGYGQTQALPRSMAYDGGADVLSWQQTKTREAGESNYPPEVSMLQRGPPRAASGPSYLANAAGLQRSPPRAEVNGDSRTAEVARLRHRVHELSECLDRTLIISERLNNQHKDLRKSKETSDRFRVQAEGEVRGLKHTIQDLRGDLRMKEKQVSDQAKVIQSLQSRLESMEQEFIREHGRRPTATAELVKPRDQSPLARVYEAIAAVTPDWMTNKAPPTPPPPPIPASVTSVSDMDDFQRRVQDLEHGIDEGNAKDSSLEEEQSNISIAPHPAPSFKMFLNALGLLDKVKADIQKQRKNITGEEICGEDELDELIGMVQFPPPTCFPEKNSDFRGMRHKAGLDIEDFMDCVEPGSRLTDLAALVHTSQCDFDHYKPKFLQLYVRQYMNMDSPVRAEILARIAAERQPA